MRAIASVPLSNPPQPGNFSANSGPRILSLLRLLPDVGAAEAGALAGVKASAPWRWRELGPVGRPENVQKLSQRLLGPLLPGLPDESTV